MNHKTSSERMAEALEQARRHWRRPVPKPVEEVPALPALAPPRVTITLSREHGAHGSQVARLVGERLNWPVYDRELLVRIAEEMGLHTALLESVDERYQGWLRECLAAFNPPPVSKYTYVRRLVEALLSLGAHGDCVIVGRGAAQVLPAKTTLRVRLVAPLPARIAAVQGRFGITREEAARRVEQTDQDRWHFVRDHFHVDPAAPSNYDLVLNTSRFTLPECADLIIEGLHRFQARTAVKSVGAPHVSQEPVAVP